MTPGNQRRRKVPIPAGAILGDERRGTRTPNPFLRKGFSSERGLIYLCYGGTDVNTISGTQESRFPDFEAAHTSGDDAQELLTIIIKQGTVISFKQCMEYPTLEGVYGEGI